MNKQEFIVRLEDRLSRLPKSEKERVLNFYNETIEDRMEDGMSEMEAVQSLDAIDDIVNQIYEEHDIPTQPYPKKNANKLLKYIALVFFSPFLFTFLAMLFVLYLMSWTVIAFLFCILIAMGALVVGAIFGMFSYIKDDFASAVILLGCMFLCIGLIPYWWKLILCSTMFLKEKSRKWFFKVKLLCRKAVY